MVDCCTISHRTGQWRSAIQNFAGIGINCLGNRNRRKYMSCGLWSVSICYTHHWNGWFLLPMDQDSGWNVENKLCDHRWINFTGRTCDSTVSLSRNRDNSIPASKHSLSTCSLLPHYFSTSGDSMHGRCMHEEARGSRTYSLHSLHVPCSKRAWEDWSSLISRLGTWGCRGK